jgi:hypothetical protein
MWIAMSKRLKSRPEKLINTLLHEMIHVWQYRMAEKTKDDSYTDISMYDFGIKKIERGHRKNFQHWMDKFNRLGFDISISDNAPVGDTTEKPMYGILFSKKALDSCVLLYTDQNFQKSIGDIVRQVESKMGEGFFDRYVYFKTTDANVFFTTRITKQLRLPRNIVNIQYSLKGVNSSIMMSPLTSTIEVKKMDTEPAETSKDVVPARVSQILSRIAKWRSKDYDSFIRTVVINVPEYAGVNVPANLDVLQSVKGIPDHVLRHITEFWMNISDIEIKRSNALKYMWRGPYQIAIPEIYGRDSSVRIKQISEFQRDYDAAKLKFANRVDSVRFKKVYGDYLISAFKKSFKKDGETKSASEIKQMVQEVLKYVV